MSNSNNLRLMAIPELSGLHFFIPDYQRGYKWEQKQVYALLRDLWTYFYKSSTSGEFYCLQPIVVKKCAPETIQKYKLEQLPEDVNAEEGAPRKDVWYEVIDGQQRLTTIRILLAIYDLMNKNPFLKSVSYQIRYATRSGLEHLFNSLAYDSANGQIVVKDSFIMQNVDVDYMLDTATSVISWFKDDNQVESEKTLRMSNFFGDFLRDQSKDKKVDVIWYETDEKADARDIFEQLNNLQVPLSSSELIRAMFLSKNAIYNPGETAPINIGQAEKDINAKKILLKEKETKQSSINAKWDEIEHYLGDENVWAFLTNKPMNSYRNRIELLFDIMSQKDMLGRDDRLYTYIWFEDYREKKGYNLWELWLAIVKSYVQLRAWYENRNYYHKIGYLIHATKGTDLPQLLNFVLEGNKKKSEFDEELITRIKKTIPNKTPINSWLYRDPDDYRKLKSILLLYNVELINQSPAEEARFPFKDYKKQEGKDENGKPRTGWTLEHIHAQNSECLDPTKRKEWIDWATYTRDARKNMINPSDEVADFISELDLLLEEKENGKCTIEDEKNFRYENIKALFERDLNLWSGNKPYIVEHQLSNLALLSGEVNSSIGKGSFFVKQQSINCSIADGEYVPKATQMVFMKHYYSRESIAEKKARLLSRQLLTWDDDDRRNYLNSIKTTLAEYSFVY